MPPPQGQTQEFLNGGFSRGGSRRGSLGGGGGTHTGDGGGGHSDVGSISSIC